MYEKRILEVYRYCNVRSFPIDCNDIIQKLGYRIVTYQSLAKGDRKKLIELMQISNDAFIIRRERTMYINANADRRRQRFTKCHEIGHIVIPTNDENEADTFASEILAPLPVVARYGRFSAIDICKRFDVSVAMANRVVASTRGKIITDDEGILDYFIQMENEDRKQKVMKKHKEPYMSEKYAFIRNETNIDWNEMQLARWDFDSYFY